MRKIMYYQLILIIMLFISTVAFASPFEASIVETWNNEVNALEFIVTNNDDDYYITNVAVENPTADSPALDNAFDYAYVITRANSSSTWYAPDEEGEPFPISWLTNGGNWLGDATKGFLYEGDFSGSDEGIAPGATMYGFYGFAELPASTFAVRWNDSPPTIISGTTVPIPGAVWLLGSGLIGIVGIRRKFKK